MKLLSIVSGTYNRLACLKRMVASVRASLGLGLEDYEIVLVDGGSTDGTIAWALSQPDVVLIQQGALLGAVKAFNAGCEAATGLYVVLANDDVEFVDYTLLAALSFMQDNPNVGIGALYQDRSGLDMHVERMPCVVDGKQEWLPYGQVCIVPKVLGDKVGWWGDYLHTYGGDNELSCRVYELGYKVEPVPGSGVHDLKLDDALRARNTSINTATGESQQWIDKWTRNGLTGPVVRRDPVEPLAVPQQYRIMYLPIVERSVQHSTRVGLNKALAKRGTVLEWDYMHKPADETVDAACCWDPALLVFQIQDPDSLSLATLKRLKANHPNATFVNWNGDYHPNNLYSDAYMTLMSQFDLAGFVTASVAERYEQFGINWFYWQIGYEEASIVPDSRSPHHDVLFLGNGYSEARYALAHNLRSLAGVDVGLYGYWPKCFAPNGHNLYDFDAGAALYAASKIAIGDSQWPDAIGYTSNRLFQAMAAGAFLLQQRFSGMQEYLGLAEGKHLACWTTLAELNDVVRYWLDPVRAEERAAIAEAGQAYVLEHHSFDVRVSELFERI